MSEPPADAAASRRRSLGDLVSLSVLPAIWLDVPPLDLAGSLAEALRAALDLAFVYVRLRSGEPPIDLLRGDEIDRQRPDLAGVRSIVRDHVIGLGELRSPHLTEPPRSIDDPRTGNPLRLICLRISSAEEPWLMALASHRQTFPTAEEQLLITLATNQAAMVLQRNQAMTALREAERVAVAASHAKDEFLANVSHEIRTPMNAIMGMTDLVLGMELGPVQRQMLLTARAAAENLLVLLEGVLDFSKIEAGRLVLEERTFSVRTELAGVLATLSLKAKRKGLELASHVSDDVPESCRGDAGRLRQVLMNLIDNAIKFTARGAVNVTVDADDADLEGLLRFAVTDTGIGIAHERQASIFEPFVQEDTSTTREYGGTGLGLTIAARLVALLGGRITVASAPGQGSRFTFTARLPRAMEPVPPPGNSTDTAQGGRKLRVLVAEDSEFNAQLVTMLLERAGHDFALAATGYEALRLSEGDAYDVLLLDLHMPGLDGFQVVERIRERERGTDRHLPVIAFTARVRSEDRDRCRAAGMDGFLDKPLRAAALWDVLARVLPAEVVS